MQTRPQPLNSDQLTGSGEPETVKVSRETGKSEPGAIVQQDLEQEAGTSDAELLSRFIHHRDADAFSAIVRRYERLVMGVAVRQVGDRDRAEDVFQATFVVLAERARRIRKPDALASWLHGTARRIGLKALADSQRRHPSTNMIDDPPIEESVLEEMRRAYEQQALDEELAQLPEALRVPVVLHYLEGLTGREVAARLGVSVDTVEGRLKRGRNELRSRLVRRGVGFGVVVVAFQMSQQIALASSSALAESTAAASVAWITHQTVNGCTANAARLAGKELAAMTAAKTATILVGTAVLCLGTGLFGAWAMDGVGIGSRSGNGDSFLIAPVDTASEHQDAAGEHATSLLLSANDGDDQREDTDGPASIPDDSASAAGEATQTNGRRSVPGGAFGSELPGADVNPGSTDMQGTSGMGMESMYGMGMGGAMGGMEAMNSGSPHSYRKLSPTRQKIEQFLDSRTMDLDVSSLPLGTLVGMLSERFGIPVILDQIELAENGIGPDELLLDVPIGLTPRETLNLALENVGGVHCDYVIRDGVLKITTHEQADAFQETAVYDLQHLEPSLTTEDVITLLPNVTDGPWWEVDGIGGAINPISGGMVVRQTQRNHHEIEQLLDQLTRFSSREDTAGQSGMEITFDDQTVNNGVTGTISGGMSREGIRGATGGGAQDDLAGMSGEVGQRTGGLNNRPEADTMGVSGMAEMDGEMMEAMMEMPRGAASRKSEIQGSYRNLSLNEQKIEDALDRTMDLPLSGGDSLDGALVTLGEKFDIPIMLDVSALSDLGVAPDEELSDVPVGLSLRDTFEILLKDVGGVELDYVTEAGILKITTAESAEQFQETVIYELRHLAPALTANDVVAVVESMINRPERIARGQAGVVDSIPGAIVVTHTQRVHREIQSFLEQLEEFSSRTDLPPPERNLGPPVHRGTGGGFF